MRAALLLLVVAGCGRIAFDDATATVGDASALTYRDAVLASGPRAYYRLDETAEGTVADASGNGHDGSLAQQMGTTLSFGQVGALASDPSAAIRIIGDGNSGPGGDTAVVFDPALMDWSGDFTVELFVNAHADPPTVYTDAVFICEEYLASGFRIGWTNTRQLAMWTDQGAGTSHITLPGMFEYGVYMHVVLAHQGTTFALYRDGTLQGQEVVDYVPVTADAQCGFGAFHGMPADATYDEVAVYDRALDLGEIQSHLSAR